MSPAVSPNVSPLASPTPVASPIASPITRLAPVATWKVLCKMLNDEEVMSSFGGAIPVDRSTLIVEASSRC